VNEKNPVRFSSPLMGVLPLHLMERVRVRKVGVKREKQTKEE